MAIPRKIENEFKYIDGDLEIIYDARLEELSFANGLISGKFLLFVCEYPAIDEDLTGLDKIKAKIIREFKGRVSYAGNSTDIGSVILCDNGKLNLNYKSKIISILEKNEVKHDVASINLAFSPLEKQLTEYIDSVEE
jgi:hypothetical protein